jgi:hypothetical protein
VKGHWWARGLFPGTSLSIGCYSHAQRLSGCKCTAVHVIIGPSPPSTGTVESLKEGTCPDPHPRSGISQTPVSRLLAIVHSRIGATELSCTYAVVLTVYQGKCICENNRDNGRGLSDGAKAVHVDCPGTTPLMRRPGLSDGR